MNIATLDVRAEFRSGLHPREKIQTALMNLGGDETLRLVVSFKPVPLLLWAASKGFAYETSRTPEDDWEVLFTRRSKAKENRVAAPKFINENSHPAASTENIELDARGLEPPHPLMRILEAVTRLPRGASLHARTDRRPIHLYSPLQERGFTGESEEQPDGSFITHIQHA